MKKTGAEKRTVNGAKKASNSVLPDFSENINQSSGGNTSQNGEKNEKFSKNAFENIFKAVKRFACRIADNYKYWLYHGEKKNGKVLLRYTRTWAVLLFALLIAFALYYVGLFDVPFVKRPDGWKENSEKFAAIFKKEPVETDSVESEETETSEIEPDRVPSVDLTDTLKKPVKEQKINLDTVFKTSDELYGEGYYLTDGEYVSSTCEVGLLTFDFELPEKYSYGNMKKRTWTVTEYDSGEESTVVESETETERPAIYLYMGYMIFDDAGKNLYLLDNVGNVLMEYDSDFIPAFARDKSGEPLFYTTYDYYAEVPVAVEENEVGEEEVTKTETVLLSGKKYYSLSYGGNYFIENDYVEERDGRGLNFDFTSDYGITDSDIIRIGILSPKFSRFLNGTSALVNFMNWGYCLSDDPAIPKLEDIVSKHEAYGALSIEEKLELTANAATPNDEYDIEENLPYLYAYNYRENYAVVVTDDPEITGEEPMYETKELRVIDTYGNVTFNSRKEFYNTELQDYCSERYLLPLSKGEDSIGHLYFDHGLLRLRKLAYDKFQLEEYGDFRVNIDKDVLVYPNGDEFPIPQGYTLKGYSDGILLLEKDGAYGYMNYLGKWIADPEYIYAGAFHGGVGVLQNASGKYCAVDVDGNYVLPPNYDYISNRSDGLIATYSEKNGWKVYGIFTK